MSLKKKLILLFLLVGIIPMVVALAVGYTSASKSIEKQVFAQLVSMRDGKKSETTNYFTQIEGQAATLSEDLMVIGAMNAFKVAYRELKVDDATLESHKKAVSAYYQGALAQAFVEKSPEGVNATDYMPTNPASIALQRHYIVDNPNPLGAKDELRGATDGSTYSQIHSIYHPAFRSFLKKFGYYDIFLVDAKTGDVVYTVYKEMDFTANLTSGPLGGSGLGRAFKKAVESKAKGSVHAIDFSAYVPSYNAPAAFVASPIYDNAEITGVLVFQLPVDKINQILTFDQKWMDVGLGASGETYIVNNSRIQLSNSRGLIEDRAGYLSNLKRIGTPERAMAAVEKLGSTVGLIELKTSSVDKAVSGETGVHVIDNHLGVSTLSAYAPLKVLGLDWGIIAEINEAEAFSALGALKKITIVLLVVISGILVVVGYFFTTGVTRPVISLNDTMTSIGATGDLTLRVDATGKDEIGAMGESFNGMLDKFQNVVRNLHSTADHLASASEELSASATEMAAGTIEQDEKAQHVATASQELNATIIEVARNVSGAAVSARQTNEAAVGGSEVVKRTIESMRGIATTAKESSDVILRLGERSQEIGKIIKVIDDIADQTNLLALNAAIEAARAGEQGRGFAVVADEVRKLAERTSKATKEIGVMITSMQGETEKAISTMEKEVLVVEEGVGLAEEAGKALRTIAEQIASVTLVIEQIATASEEQSTAADQISGDIEAVAKITRGTTDGVEQIKQASESMAKLASGLQSEVAQFKVDGAEGA
jgi:methyl-accepting chemotaxis protein